MEEEAEAQLLRPALWRRKGSATPEDVFASTSKISAGSKVCRTKSDSQAVRSRSVTTYDGSSPVRRFAKLSVPERLRSKSWDAALGGMDARLTELIRRDRPTRQSKRKTPLTALCLHCRYTFELSKSRVSAEIGKAVQTIGERRRRRISLQPTSGGGAQAPVSSKPLRVAKETKPPDIIVSSVSSDEDTTSQEASIPEIDPFDINWTEASTSASSENSTSPSLTGDSDDSLGQLYSGNGEDGPFWGEGDGGGGIPSIAISGASLNDLRGDLRGQPTRKSERSCSIATAASEADTLIFQPSPSPDALSLSQPGSPMPPETPSFSPPASPAHSDMHTPVVEDFVGITFDESAALHLNTNETMERPILDSISSGKASCSCLPPGCLRPLLPRRISGAKSDSSALLSSYSDGYAHLNFSSQSASVNSMFLEAPSVGSQRSSSVDLPTLSRDIQLLSSEGSASFGSDDSQTKIRSKSVDCGLNPIRRQSRMQRLTFLFRKALVRSPIVGARSPLLASAAQNALANPPARLKATRYWQEGVSPNEHIWLSDTGQGSECGVGEKECRKTGEKWICSACHLVVHSSCLHLLPKMNFYCKPTFADSVGQPTSSLSAPRRHVHHWIHRWKQDGKCARCQKSFNTKLFNRDKEIVGISCSWCKIAYHNRQGCFLMADLEASCDRGQLCDVIVPTDWVLKLPMGTSRVTGIRRRLSHCQGHASHKRRSRKARLFTVKPPDPVPTHPAAPIIIFVNPKSGGNKGAKLLNAFNWLLNPRQVFDIMTMKGPKYGLEMYRKLLPRLRILVCGGDGTVGWVLASLDALGWATYPPLAILPLGTGNDLARTLGWGGTFPEGEELARLLQNVSERSETTSLDRWVVELSGNAEAEWEETPAESAESVTRALPLSVFNNYFSIGADAHVALQFHHSRSANPEILNSRFKNRLFYGGMGGLDLFKRSWKDLSDYISIVCDGVDLTPKIREAKFHCLLFLNIPRYAGGTQPWGSSRGGSPGEDDVSGGGSSSSLHLQPPSNSVSGPTSFTQPSINDGRMEVLGFTSASLAAIQMGGHGERLAQCRSVKMLTWKPIPAQIDGEPCKLAPSHISIRFHSKVPMLQKTRRSESSFQISSPHPSPTLNIRKQFRSSMEAILLRIPVAVISWRDYEVNKDDVEQLKLRAWEMGLVSVNSESELGDIRDSVGAVLSSGRRPPNAKDYEPGTDWHFVDYISCNWAFRVPLLEEGVFSVSDVANPDEVLLVLDDAFPSLPAQTSAETEWQRRRSSRKRRKRFSQPLKLVLTGEKGETAL